MEFVNAVIGMSRTDMDFQCHLPETWFGESQFEIIVDNEKKKNMIGLLLSVISILTHHGLIKYPLAYEAGGGGRGAAAP